MTIIEACRDQNLFGPWFRHRATWSTWLLFLKALFALPLTAKELVVFQGLTGRATTPMRQAEEAKCDDH